VWNRSRARAAALEPLGTKVADTPARLMAEVDVACTCVATPAALEEVAAGKDGMLAAARRGQLWIDFTTIGPDQARSLEQRAAAVGVDFVEAPVTGSKTGAEKGTLLIMAGGSTDALSRAEPVFGAVGEKWIHCGPVGAGSQVKLAGNALIAAMLQALGEGMLLATKTGVDPDRVLEVIQASGFRSPYFEFKGNALLRRDFQTHFSIDLMHKDLGLFLESAAANRVPTPTAAAVRQCYELARAAGKGEQDIGAVITVFEQLVGTEIRPKS
ncbi:MAG TPA: NAD(P)-dependent oxidoreductase, partial [Myxococcaceae bacterium]|nr:NAD(P)-dependent oxidoreductase [Myxococcaceae bacterium]